MVSSTAGWSSAPERARQAVSVLVCGRSRQGRSQGERRCGALVLGIISTLEVGTLLVVPRTWLDPLGSLLQRLGLPARCSGPWNAGRGSPKTVAVLSKPVPGLRARCVLFACGVERRKRKAETPQLVSFRRFLASLVAWMASLGGRAPVDDWAG